MVLIDVKKEFEITSDWEPNAGRSNSIPVISDFVSSGSSSRFIEYWPGPGTL